MGLLAPLALVLMFTSACGYALAGRGSFLPEYIRVVGIPAFEYKATEVVFDIDRPTPRTSMPSSAASSPTCS
jgi:hypothetical protein